MGAAFGMSGPTLSGSKRQDSKAEVERKHTTVQEAGNKVLLGKKAVNKFMNAVGGAMPSTTAAPEGAAFGMR